MTKNAHDKIADGLRSAIAVVRGDEKPSRVHAFPDDHANVTSGSENVFRDLRLDDADELLRRARKEAMSKQGKLKR